MSIKVSKIPIKVSNSVSEPPRPIVPNFTISAEKARVLTEISIREKVFESITKAVKVGNYKTFIQYDLPASLMEELEELGYKISYLAPLNEYEIDWSKDNGTT